MHFVKWKYLQVIIFLYYVISITTNILAELGAKCITQTAIMCHNDQLSDFDSFLHTVSCYERTSYTHFPYNILY